MKDSPAASAITGSSEPSTIRLVIRAEILPEGVTRPAAKPAHRHTALLTIAGIAALALICWIAFGVLSRPPSSTIGEVETSRNIQRNSMPATPNVAVTSPPANISAASNSLSPAPHASVSTPTPTHEELPAASRNALQTIRGTIRVSIRVTLDQSGAVTSATATEPGPSRYFERVSLEAAKKWQFTPSDSNDPRSELIRFNFTRYGVLVAKSPP